MPLKFTLVTVHTAGRNEFHVDKDKLKLTVFNKSKRARKGKAETDRNTGVVTSRPD